MMSHTFIEQVLKDGSLIENYWPESLGTIVETKESDSPYLVFVIQDAYSELDIQSGIMKILRHLQRQHGLRHVCLEGAVGDFPEFSRITPPLTEQEKKELLALVKGYNLSGPEYLAITESAHFKIYGAENSEQYRKNLETEAQAYKVYRVFGRVFERLAAYVTNLKVGAYSAELLRFDQAIQEQEAGKLTLAELLHRWISEYERQGKIHLNRYPAIENMIRISRLETALEMSKVRPETNRLIEDIITLLSVKRVPYELFDRVVLAKYQLEGRDTTALKKLPRSALVKEYNHFVEEIVKRLARLALQVRLEQLPTREMYSYVVDLSGLCGLDIRRYPNLLTYLHSLYSYHALLQEDFLTEIHLMVEDARMALFTDPFEADREVARAWRALIGLQKICSLASSPEDCERFESEFGCLSLSELMQKIITRNSLSPAAHEQWYQEMLLGPAGEAYSTKQEIVDALFKAFGIERELLPLLHLLFGSELEILSAIFAQFGSKSPLKEPYHDAELSEAPDLHWAKLIAAAIDIALEGAYKFFQLAPARGRSLTENTLQRMKEQGVTVVALVAGGFLTNYVLPVLEREDVAFKLIRPKTKFRGRTRGEYWNSFETRKEMPPLLQNILKRIEPSKVPEENTREEGERQ